MKTKKIFVIGALALVVIGCIFAAGCTTSQSVAPLDEVTAAVLDEIAGQWDAQYTWEGTTYEVIQMIERNGTGLWVVLDGYTVFDSYTSIFGNFDANGNFEKTSSNGITYQMTYTNGTLIETGGDTSEPIVYTKVA